MADEHLFMVLHQISAPELQWGVTSYLPGGDVAACEGLPALEDGGLALATEELKLHLPTLIVRLQQLVGYLLHQQVALHLLDHLVTLEDANLEVV